MPIFENIRKMIPLNFNIFMIKVWKGDPHAVVRFIIEVIQSDTMKWDSFDENIRSKKIQS